jgi:hypothetical protein
MAEAFNPATGQRLRWDGKAWKPIGELSDKDDAALALARRDAESGERMARQADRFVKYNRETGTGGLRNTQISIPMLGRVLDVPAIMENVSPNWGAMNSLAAATAPKDRVEGSGSTSDFEARMNLIGFPSVTQLGPTNTQTAARIKAESRRARARAGFLDRWAAEQGTLLGGDTAFLKWWDKYSKDEGIESGIKPTTRAAPPRKAAPAAKDYRVISVE